MSGLLAPASVNDPTLLLRLVQAIEALHQPRKRVIYHGLRSDWDGRVADVSEAMVRHEETVCTAGCGRWPCETLRTVRRG